MTLQIVLPFLRRNANELGRQNYYVTAQTKMFLYKTFLQKYPSYFQTLKQSAALRKRLLVCTVFFLSPIQMRHKKQF